MKTRSRHLPLLLLACTLAAAPSHALKLDTQLSAESLAIATLTAAAPAAQVLESDQPYAPERAAITGYLRANLGEPYRFGAAGGREGFDCSGLVLRAYEAAGLEVPRVSAEQMRTGAPVSFDDLRAGDLLFYRMRANAPQRLHVVVYVGEGRAIHASVTHKKVQEIDITRDVWANNFIAARSLL